MSIPYIAVGNDELKDCIEVKKGDLIECTICKKVHPLEHGKDSNSGKESTLLGFYHCDKNGHDYLASIVGKLVTGLKLYGGKI